MALRSNPLLHRQWNNPQIGAIASNLASIFTPNSADYENQAQADYYTSKTAEQNIKNAAMQDLPLRSNMAPGDDIGTLAGAFINAGGAPGQFGDYLLALKAQSTGATPQGLGMSQLGAGQPWGNTYDAFQAKQAQDFRVEGMKDQTERWKVLNTPRNLPANNAMYATPEQRGAWGMPEDGTDPIIGVLQAGKGQEIHAPGMDPIVNAVTGGDGSDGLGPEGKGVPAWALRTLLDPNALPQEKAAAKMAMAKPRWAQSPDGQWHMYTPEVPDFSAYDTAGNQDVSRAGEAAPGVISPTVAPAPVPAQSGLAPAGPAASPVPAGTQPAAPNPLTTSAPSAPGITDQVVGAPKPFIPNEYQGKARNWASLMSEANTFLNKLATGDPANGIAPYTSPDSMAWGINSNMPAYASGNLMSENAIRFFSYADQFLGPILRQESGAAISPEEYPRYYRRFIALPNDPPDVVAAKALARDTATRLLAESSADPNLHRSMAEERALAEQIFATVGDPYAAGLGNTAPQPGAPPAAPAQSAAEPAEGAVYRNPATGERVKLQGGQWVPLPQGAQ